MRTLQMCIFFGTALGLVSPAWSLDTQKLPLSLDAVVRPAPVPMSSKSAGVVPGEEAFAAKRQARRDAALGKIPVPQDALEREATARLRTLARARAVGFEGRRDLHHLTSGEAVDGLARLLADDPSSFRIDWHETSGVPRFIAGRDLLAGRAPIGSTDAEDIAALFLRDQKALFQLDEPDAEMKVFDVIRDDQGFEAVRFAQQYQGREVWGHDVVVRLDPAGKVIGFSGQHLPSSKLSVLTPAFDEFETVRIALETMESRHGGEATSESADLLYFPHGNRIHLAWKILASVGLQHREEVFVDAESGEVLHTLSKVYDAGPSTGSGTGLLGVTRSLDLYEIDNTHFMIDTTKDMFDAAGSNLPNTPKGGIHIIDARNGEGNELFNIVSTDPNDWGTATNAVSASYFAGLVYDYFFTRHGRNSIDGNGVTMTVIVNFNNDFNNAFWSAPYMVFGNGDGTAFSDLAGSFDVTAHEMSHGVTENTANLIYEFQSGALNEHFSDAFGASADFALQGASANWLLGEHVTTPNIAGDCLRNMMDPGASNVAFNGQQPTHMSEFRNLGSDQDNGGVHINSGIPNRAFYIATVDEGLGIERTERIWYRALSQYLTRNSQFIDFRLAIIRAATDLYDTATAQSVANALDAVGIVDGEPNDPPGDLPDNPGTDFLALVDVQTGHILATDVPDFSSVNDLSGETISAAGRPAFSDDGAWFAWVDGSSNIRLTSLDGQSDFAVTTDGRWSSVAINADASIIAATSIFEDGLIYAFDLVNSTMNGIEIKSQNSTDGQTPDLVAYADVLEFSVNGDYLLFDALSRTSIGEQTLEYWDISLLRTSDLQFFRVFPPLPPGQSVGNPTFGQNNDNLMAFDSVDQNGNVLVVGVNFETGASGTITNNFSSPGRPTFSGDDSAVFYEFRTSERDETWVVGLESDGVTGDGKDVGLFADRILPVHFTVGSRPSPVLLTAFDGNWEGDEVTLQWTVPDPDLYLGFVVERSDGAGAFVRVETSVRTLSAGQGRYEISDLPPEAESTLDYRLQAIAPNGEHEFLGQIQVIRGHSSSATARLALLSIAPNPIRTSTSFRFAIPAGSSRLTSLSLYDIQGRVVARPLRGEALEAGIHEIEWSLSNTETPGLASGVYFVRLEHGRETVTRRISILAD